MIEDKPTKSNVLPVREPVNALLRVFDQLKRLNLGKDQEDRKREEEEYGR